jgi:hypothetical protein
MVDRHIPTRVAATGSILAWLMHCCFTVGLLPAYRQFGALARHQLVALLH